MHVEPGGPAESGGALLGDILISLDTQTFDSIEDLHDVLLQRQIGDEVTATVIRGGQKVELKFKIGERPVR
jgi:S1-C subfamily serine protease